MTDAWAPLLTGIAAGLAIAMPLGAIGALLLNEGLTGGWRRASAGALGVATVDVVYAAAAVIAGAFVAGALTGFEPALRLAGAIAIGAVVVHGILKLRRASTQDLPVPTGSPARVFARFLTLTALNPATIIYFTVIAAGFADQFGDAAARMWFVAGVGIGSLAWQLTLAAGASLLGLRASERTKVVLSAIGYSIAAAFAVVLAWSAFV